MKTYSIYTLNHPITNEIRYVGQTCQDLNIRLRKHLCSKDKSYRTNWIKSLLNENLKPEIKLIIDGLNKEESDNLEKYYIKTFKESGIKLINMTDGGEGTTGYYHDEETRYKLSSIRKKQKEEQIELLNQLQNKIIHNEITPIIDNDKIKLQPNRKTIYQYDLDGNLINVFPSLREIERKLGYFKSNISPCLHGKTIQAYGFYWSY